MAKESNKGKSEINEALNKTAASIPDQNSIIRFEVSSEDKLELVPTLGNQNDFETIKTIRQELLALDGPVTVLQGRYSLNPNAPQASLFRPLVDKYYSELSKEFAEINYTTLYVRGARFFAARLTAERQVASGEWPELEAGEADAIGAICDLHGPLIMATAVGRKLVVDAYEYKAQPDALRREQEVSAEFGKMLANATDVIEPETADVIADITAPIDDDPQPIRSRSLRLLLAGSALVALVGGVAWLAVGGAAATIVSLGAGRFTWEVVKKTGDFKQVTDVWAKKYDTISDEILQRTMDKQAALLMSIKRLVDRESSLFRQVANLLPEFHWAKKYLNKSEASTRPLEAALIEEDENSESVQFSPLSTPTKTLKALTAIAYQVSQIRAPTRDVAVKKFGRSAVQDLFALGLLKNGIASMETEASELPKSQHHTLLKNRAAATDSMTLVRQELLKNNDISTVELAQIVGEALERPWSKGSLQRHGGAFKTWARWIDPHVIDPTKSTYEYDPSEFDHPSNSRGRRKRKINPAVVGRVSVLAREGHSDPAIGEKLNISVRNVKQVMTEADREIRKLTGMKRRKLAEPRLRQATRWKGFNLVPLEEKCALADLWYGDGHVDRDIRPKFEMAGAPKGFSRSQLNRLLGPRDGSRIPAWYVDNT